MPSDALASHLPELLRDAYELVDSHDRLMAGLAERERRPSALNRAVVVVCVSAWEAYVEELVREAVSVLRPAAPPMGQWPTWNASVRGQLGRFNTPNSQNVRSLLSDSLGLEDVRQSWTCEDFTATEALRRLDEAMSLRHQISHGVNPRPVIDEFYSSRLPVFFIRLGRCTDEAVRRYLLDLLAVANPWPS